TIEEPWLRKPGQLDVVGLDHETPRALGSEVDVVARRSRDADGAGIHARPATAVALRERAPEHGTEVDALVLVTPEAVTGRDLESVGEGHREVGRRRSAKGCGRASTAADRGRNAW